MTIQQLLDRKSIIDKDSFPPELKVMWLSELDGQLYIEVINTHENPEGIKFEPYAESDLGKPLLVPFPYDKLYVPYLMAKVAEAYGESEEYNNHTNSFITAMNEFKAYWNRTHMPISPIQKKQKTTGTLYVYTSDNPLEANK